MRQNAVLCGNKLSDQDHGFWGRSTLSLNFKMQKKKPFKKHCGRSKNADNQHFLLFSQCFLLYQRKIAQFEPQSLIFCKYFQFGKGWKG